MTMIVPGVFSMQMGVPHSKFGKCGYLMPEEIREWLSENIGPFDYYHCGSCSSGSGYTDGVSNAISFYIVKWLKPEDGTLFKLRFPEITIYMDPQYE